MFAQYFYEWMLELIFFFVMCTYKYINFCTLIFFGTTTETIIFHDKLVENH
jgi:hypothetical protein